MGGIIGKMSYDNTGSDWRNSYNCFVNITAVSNSGMVSGVSTVGELIGVFWSDGSSTVTGYTVTGKIVINDELLEGEYDVGSNTNLTLSGREIYGAENTEATE